MSDINMAEGKFGIWQDGNFSLCDINLKVRSLCTLIHGLVPAEILKEYCDQHSIKEFIIPDIMTYDHPHRERSGRVILQRRIVEVKTMQIDSRMNKYNPRNPNRRAVEKRVGEIEANCTRRAKTLDATFTAIA